MLGKSKEKSHDEYYKRAKDDYKTLLNANLSKILMEVSSFCLKEHCF